MRFVTFSFKKIFPNNKSKKKKNLRRVNKVIIHLEKGIIFINNIYTLRLRIDYNRT